jgi:hypothetical protein
MAAIARFDTRDVERTIRQLKARYPRAIKRALNRAATSARAGLASDVAKDMKLKVADVKKAMTIGEASETRHVATLYASAKRVPLEKFGATGPLPSRGQGVGVRVKGKTYAGAFRARMRSGHIGVFQRAGASARKSPGAWSKNLPIVELRGASIWQSAMKHLPAALARGEAALTKNLASELRYVASVENST